jgi:hypothetical protein
VFGLIGGAFVSSFAEKRFEFQKPSIKEALTGLGGGTMLG